MTLTRRDLQTLSERQRQALARALLHAKRGPRGFPVSAGQRALWSLHELHPEQSAYHVALAFRTLAQADRAALGHAFDELANRHETLRTVYSLEAGSVRQRVLPPGEADVRIVDALSWTEDELASRVREAAFRPFDLERGPVFRARIFHRPDGHDVFLLAAHHIALDFWSVDVFLEELAWLYDGGCGSRGADLPEPRKSYGDFTRHETEMMRTAAAGRSLQYWRQQLENVPPLGLPTTRPRGRDQSFDGATLGLEIDAACLARLRTFAHEQKATLFVVLLSAFKMLLGRYTGQRDIAVGVPTANRPGAGYARAVGYFVNPVVIRSNLSGAPTVAELVDRVRRNVRDALAHKRLPFPDLVERLGARREDPSRSPLFDVMFVYQGPRALKFETRQVDSPGMSPLGARLRTPRTVAFAFGTLTAERYPLGRPSVPFDLELEIIEADGALYGLLSYKTALFSEAIARELLDQYHHTLDVIAELGDRSIHDPLLVNASAHERIAGWNTTATEYDLDAPLHAVIRTQAERTPDRVALVHDGAHLSYGELVRRAASVASGLSAAGVTTETPVGVFMERSIELPIALLGVLESGGAYVPLEPDYPDARVQQVLSEVAAPVVVTQRHLRHRLPSTGVRAVLVDDAQEDAPFVAPSVPESLAYVIFTSGSTGRPKGAMNTHRSVVNRLCWMQDALHLIPDDRVLHKTPFGFDVSVWELFWPLMQGATMIIAAPGGHRDPSYLIDLIRREQVTTTHFVPSLLTPFLQDAAADACTSLRHVVCSGESLSWELQEDLLRRLPACRLFNLYGPTETAVDVTWHRCRGSRELRPVPVGQPIANTRILVLDRELAEVPVGVPGELCVAGIAVGRGYYARPALTAERFVPDPSGAAGERMYRTGDLARWLEDGTLQLFGRLDDQIKIHGNRVEPGEVAIALQQHAGVGDAAVIADATGAGTRLIAYYVCNGERVAPSELREFLGERLPLWMVPAALVPLESLPLTMNGKLDRRSLPAPESTAAPATAAPPRTDIERLLIELWSSTLGVKTVGIHDDFFALGGDSISTITISARARRLGVPLCPGDVFKYPTIAELARRIQRSAPIDETTAETTQPAPLTPVQHWLVRQPPQNLEHWTHVLWLDVSGDADVASLRRAIEAVYGAHESLRLRFSKEGDTWLQQADGSPVCITHVDVGAPAPERQYALASAVAAHVGESLSHTTGPAFRAVLMTGEARAVVLAAHHLVIDAVSWLLIVDELETAWAQAMGGHTELPRESTSYTEYARRLTVRADSSDVRSEGGYWESALRRALPLPAPAHPSADRSVVTRTTIDAADTHRLLHVAPVLHRTDVSEILLAAFLVGLKAEARVTSLAIDIERHGRADDHLDLDITRTTGWFTTVFPLTFDLSAARHAMAVLQDVKRRFREVPGIGQGYGLLRHVCGSGGAEPLRASAEASVCFNYIGRWNRSGSAANRMRLNHERSRFNRGGRGQYAIELTAMVLDSGVMLDWRHDEGWSEVVGRVAAELTATIQRFSTRDADSVRVSSDFPLARLTNQDFATLTRALAGH